jgi:hypothetical protein
MIVGETMLAEGLAGLFRYLIISQGGRVYIQMNERYILCRSLWIAAGD